MFEIKLSQGAKPGKGGILPGAKVTGEIASIRAIAEGEDSISPYRNPAIDSADGGTGAAPASLFDYMGLPLKESLPLVADILGHHGLRERRRTIASGKLTNPGQVAWAMCAGADLVASACGYMLALGCVQALQCNKNTCPTGITTHDPRLQRGLDVHDKAERVARYAQRLMKEEETIAHSRGVAEPRLLQRKHCRQFMQDGTSIPLDELYAKSATLP